MHPIVNMFVTCEYVTMGMGERPTVVDVFNNIHFNQLPGSHSFTLFARLLAEPDSYPITIQAQREGAEKSIEIFSSEITINPSGAHNILLKEDFSFDHPGRYTFSLHSATERLAQTHLLISVDTEDTVEEKLPHETETE